MGCTFEASCDEELTAHETDLKVHRAMISLKVQELNHVDVLRNQVNEALASLVEATQNQRDLTNRIALLEGRMEEMQTERREQTRSSSLPDVMAPPVPPPVRIYIVNSNLVLPPTRSALSRPSLRAAWTNAWITPNNNWS